MLNIVKKKKYAKKVNSDLPISIAKLKDRDTYLIHFSSDHVYSGIGPHSEKKKIIPLNHYARTKLLSEKILNENKYCCILRTNFFGKSEIKNRKSFSDWVVYNLKNKKEIKLYKDIFFSPLSMHSLSKVLIKIISKKITGIYNLGSRAGMSKAMFGIYFKNLLNLKNINLRCVKYYKMKTKLKRPHDMRMNCKKIENKLGIKLNKLIDEIKITAKDYK